MTLRGTTMVAALTMLAGCQTAEPVSEVDTQAQILAAIPANYRQETAIFLRGSLEPNPIADAQITQPMLGSLGSSDEAQVPLICVRLTFRETAGTTPQTIALVFRDGQIINRIDNNAACSNPTYGAFPELRTPA